MINEMDPNTDPKAEPNNPIFNAEVLISTLRFSFGSKQFNELIVNLRLCATREENRNELKATISNTISLLIFSMPTLHDGVFPTISALSLLKEKPMKIATVKSEFTFTMLSMAVTWMLVLDLDVVGVESLL